MDEQSKQEKSTGYSPPTKTGKGNASAPVESTGKKKASPVLKDAHLKDESLISTGGVLASEILAIQVMMGDFKALKDAAPMSWQASSNGKIYWCAEMPGHKLSILDKKLLVDGVPADEMLSKILEEGEK